MKAPRIRHCIALLVLALIVAGPSLAQIPSARLQVSTSSGFLGIGSPRYVIVRLATANRESVLTSEAVNGSSLYYFLLTPADRWLPDEEFYAATVPTLRIRQNDAIIPLETMSPFSPLDSSILLGYPKSFRIELPFELMIGLEDEIFTAPFAVPSELWPFYERLASLSASALTHRREGEYRFVISAIDSALMDPRLGMFPQLADLRQLRTTTVMELANSATTHLDSVVADGSIPLGDKVDQAAASAEALQFAADTLQAASLGIVLEDPALVTMALRVRSQAARSLLTRDSLQQQFDLDRVGWILEKGNHARGGIVYRLMIEALAYGFSSLEFLDTNQTTFVVELPAGLERSLTEENAMNDFRIFVRMCNDRYLHGVPLFPVEFLPTLRRDTSQYNSPVYYMLDGVAEYWTGGLSKARDDAFAVLRRASDSVIVTRYDLLRMAAEYRLRKEPPAGLESLVRVRRLLARGDTLGARSILDAEGSLIPRTPRALLNGDLALARGDTVGALGQYATAWLADRRAIDAYLRSAGVLRSRGELQRSVEILHLALDAGNTYWIVYDRLGQALLKTGDPSGALNAYSRALEILPRSYETAIGTGRAYQALGDLRRAREYYNRAITIDPLRTEAVDLLTELNRMSRPPR